MRGWSGRGRREREMMSAPGLLVSVCKSSLIGERGELKLECVHLSAKSSRAPFRPTDQKTLLAVFALCFPPANPFRRRSVDNNKHTNVMSRFSLYCPFRPVNRGFFTCPRPTATSHHLEHHHHHMSFYIGNFCPMPINTGTISKTPA